MPSSERTSTASEAQNDIDEVLDEVAKQERKALVKELLIGDGKDSETGESLTRDQKQLRIDEASAYYKHLVELDNSTANDDYDKSLIDSAHGQALLENESFDAYDEATVENEALKLADIEAKIKTEPRFRRLLRIAVDLAALRNKQLDEGESQEKRNSRTKDKEMKFTELFDWYSGEGMDEKVLEYILDKAFKIDAVEEVTNEIGINPEEETKPERAFSLGQEVKVQRTSGAVESGWKVSNFYEDAFGVRSYDVSDGENLEMLSEERLLEMQYMPETDPAGFQNSEAEQSANDVTAGEPGSDGAALEGESLEEYEARMAGGAPEKKDSKFELKVGDKVRFKNREGNVLEGKVLEVIALYNEDYFVYKVEMEDGGVVTISYAEVIPEEVQEGTQGDAIKPEGILIPESGGGSTQETEDSELRFGNYPELYAQRKNLASTKKGQQDLEAEGKKVAKNIGDYVSQQLAGFIELNPGATEEQIRQAAMGFYIEAQNSLEREVIDHIDGLKVDGQEAKGIKGRLRRFGAWMDRHGKKIKTGLLIAGGIGIAATGIGAATGAITIGFAIGAGTVIGAAKGITIGTLLQRHGSKNSAARGVDLSKSDEAKDIIAKLNPKDRQTFDAVSDWLVSQYDSAANKDHSKNVRRTTTAAVLGGALGAIAGSIQIETPTSHDVTTTETTPNAAPEVVSHQIVPNELSGQVLDKLMVDNHINLPQFLQAHNITGSGNSFALSDGSTNIGLIHAVENTFGTSFGVMGQTHSFAGADALSDSGIRAIFDAIHSNVDWGSTTTSATSIVNGSEVNFPLTAIAEGSASLAGDGVAKVIGDVVGRRSAVTGRS